MRQTNYAFQDICDTITDYVANGSFKSLANNVNYSNHKDYARLIRLVDFNNNYDEASAVWVSKASYEYLKKTILYGDEIIISNVGANVGTVFKCPKLTYNMTLGPNSILVKTNEICNQDYLYYYLKSKIGYNKLITLVSGSAMPKFNKTDLRNLEISLPNRKYQDKAAKLLIVIDNKIKLNNQINDNLYEINKQLYKRWFIDYEFPNENGKPYKTSGGKMFETELGEIPENWECKYLDELVNIVNGYSYKGKELVEKSNIGMATIKNFERNGGFKLEGYKALNPDKVKEQQIVELLDLVVAHTDLTQNADIIGNPILILSKGGFEKIVISMDLVKVVPKKNIYNKFFIFEILNSEKFKKFALGYVSGTTVLHLDKSCIKQYEVAIPNNNLIEKFSKIVETNYKKISELMAENQNLEKLRDTLLPKLMNGEIDLENIEI